MVNGIDATASEDISVGGKDITCPRCKESTNMLWSVDIEYTCSTKRRRVCKKCRDELLEEIEEVLEVGGDLKSEIKDQKVIEDITCPGCGEGATCPCVMHSISVTKDFEGKKMMKDSDKFVMFKKEDFDKFKADLFGG